MYSFDEVNQVGTIDCQYVEPGLACSYLLVEGGQAAFVETNTSHAVPLLLDALKERNLSPDRVRYIIVTHVHLDHAGGAGLLMKHCKNAALLVHPKGARHLINPSRLIASSIQVYGEQFFKKLFGEIVPIAEHRVQIMNDGDEVLFGSRKLRFLHTRGHANHHFCIHDSRSNGVFTGDSFGIAYPALQKAGPYIYPTSTPTDFDPGEARLSLSKIRETGCVRLYLTHFGEFTALDDGEKQMRDGLHFLEGLLNESVEALTKGVRNDAILKQVSHSIYERMNYELTSRRMLLSHADQEMMKLDSELNASGIVFAASRRVKSGRAI